MAYPLPKCQSPKYKCLCKLTAVSGEPGVALPRCWDFSSQDRTPPGSAPSIAARTILLKRIAQQNLRAILSSRGLPAGGSHARLIARLGELDDAVTGAGRGVHRGVTSQVLPQQTMGAK